MSDSEKEEEPKKFIDIVQDEAMESNVRSESEEGEPEPPGEDLVSSSDEIQLESDEEDKMTHKQLLSREKESMKAFHEKYLKNSTPEDEDDENFGAGDLDENQIHQNTLRQKQEVFEKQIKPVVYNLIKNIGYTENAKSHKYIKGENCLKVLKDLKKILNENTDGRVRVYLQELKLIQQDLIPLFATSISNGEICQLVLDVLILLTNPVTQEEKMQGMLLKITQTLQVTKSVFLMKDVVAYFTVALGENMIPDKNFHFIQSILLLMRNVLAIIILGTNANQIDFQFLHIMKKDGFLDLFLVILAKDGVKWPRLCLEIVSLILKDESPSNILPPKLGPNETQVSILQQVLKEEKNRKIQNSPPVRHSRFGGVVVHKSSTLGSTALIDVRMGSKLMIPKKSSVRKDRIEVQSPKRATPNDIKTILTHFTSEFLETCFNSFISECFESVVSESTQDYDHHFFAVVGFCLEFNRIKNDDFDISHVSQLFGEPLINFVYAKISLDQGYIADLTPTAKNKRVFQLMAETVVVLHELILGIHHLSNHKEEEIREGAMTLFYRLVHDQNHLHNIPKLISKYQPFVNTKQHLYNLIEISHYLILMTKENNVTVKRLRKDEDIEFDPVDFVGRQFTKRAILSNYISLFARYPYNSKRINDQVFEMIRMICEECEMSRILYHVSFLQACNQMLNDESIRLNSYFDVWIEFCKKFVIDFFVAFEQDKSLGVMILSWNTKETVYDLRDKMDVHPIVPAEDEEEMEFVTEAFDENVTKPDKPEKKRRKKKKTDGDDIDDIFAEQQEEDEAILGDNYDDKNKSESGEEYEFGATSTPPRSPTTPERDPVSIKITTPMRSRERDPSITDSPKKRTKRTDVQPETPEK